MQEVAPATYPNLPYDTAKDMSGVSIYGVVEGFENKEGKSITVDDP